MKRDPVCECGVLTKSKCKRLLEKTAQGEPAVACLTSPTEPDLAYVCLLNGAPFDMPSLFCWDIPSDLQPVLAVHMMELFDRHLSGHPVKAGQRSGIKMKDGSVVPNALWKPSNGLREGLFAGPLAAVRFHWPRSELLIMGRPSDGQAVLQ